MDQEKTPAQTSHKAVITQEIITLYDDYKIGRAHV